MRRRRPHRRSAATSSPTTRRSPCGRARRCEREALPGAATRRLSRRAAGAVPAHSVLPQALPLLLLPRVHRQERRRTSSSTSTRWSGSGSCGRRAAALAGRPLDFVYFGGGTPSFLSIRQLEGLVGRLTAVSPWTSAEEITFECEPGTLTPGKLEAIRGFGVTRLSLGVESFDDGMLELNGRAHRVARNLPAPTRSRGRSTFRRSTST